MKLYIQRKYGQIPNDILNNPTLSLRAKGLWVFLQSKPDGWSFSVDRISNQTKEGKSAIQSAMRELEKHGLLLRIPRKNEKGQWSGYDYILSEKPLAENRSTDSRLTENIVTLSNKDNSNKDNSKKEKEYNIYSNFLDFKEFNHKQQPMVNTDSKYSDTVMQTAKEIIDYLNQKTGKRYKHSNETYLRLISGRLREGYTVDDFKRVIDNKCNDWLNTDMEKYLRPSTLFSKSHFDDYLNQNTKSDQNKSQGGSLWETVI